MLQSMTIICQKLKSAIYKILTTYCDDIRQNLEKSLFFLAERKLNFLKNGKISEVYGSDGKSFLFVSEDFTFPGTGGIGS